jgi:NADH dehydrogenase FAD-containing subunit
MELRNVVLVGGGHSNVQVLKILATELKKADRVKIILISGKNAVWAILDSDRRPDRDKQIN